MTQTRMNSPCRYTATLICLLYIYSAVATTICCECSSNGVSVSLAHLLYICAFQQFANCATMYVCARAHRLSVLSTLLSPWHQNTNRTQLSQTHARTRSLLGLCVCVCVYLTIYTGLQVFLQVSSNCFILCGVCCPNLTALCVVRCHLISR